MDGLNCETINNSRNYIRNLDKLINLPNELRTFIYNIPFENRLFIFFYLMKKIKYNDSKKLKLFLVEFLY